MKVSEFTFSACRWEKTSNSTKTATSSASQFSTLFVILLYFLRTSIKLKSKHVLFFFRSWFFHLFFIFLSRNCGKIPRGHLHKGGAPIMYCKTRPICHVPNLCWKHILVYDTYFSQKMKYFPGGLLWGGLHQPPSDRMWCMNDSRGGERKPCVYGISPGPREIKKVSVQSNRGWTGSASQFIQTVESAPNEPSDNHRTRGQGFISSVQCPNANTVL